MAIPCETCDMEAACDFRPPCAAWTASFLERWQRINDYAKTVRSRPTTPTGGAVSVSPCDSCPSAEYCTEPCLARLAHWDAQMEILRKQVGG